MTTGCLLAQGLLTVWVISGGKAQTGSRQQCVTMYDKNSSVVFGVCQNSQNTDTNITGCYWLHRHPGNSQEATPYVGELNLLPNSVVSGGKGTTDVCLMKQSLTRYADTDSFSVRFFPGWTEYSASTMPLNHRPRSLNVFETAGTGADTDNSGNEDKKDESTSHRFINIIIVLGCLASVLIVIVAVNIGFAVKRRRVGTTSRRHVNTQQPRQQNTLQRPERHLPSVIALCRSDRPDTVFGTSHPALNDSSDNGSNINDRSNSHTSNISSSNNNITIPLSAYSTRPLPRRVSTTSGSVEKAVRFVHNQSTGEEVDLALPCPKDGAYSDAREAVMSSSSGERMRIPSVGTRSSMGEGMGGSSSGIRESEIPASRDLGSTLVVSKSGTSFKGKDSALLY